MKIKVDFNDLVRGGQVRVSLRRLEGPVTVGEMVTIYDPDAELECNAVVTDVDHETGRAYFSPIWEEVVDQEAASTASGIILVWDGSRMTPLTPLAINYAGGTTVDQATGAVKPVERLPVAV